MPERTPAARPPGPAHPRPGAARRARARHARAPVRRGGIRGLAGACQLGAACAADFARARGINLMQNPRPRSAPPPPPTRRAAAAPRAPGLEARVTEAWAAPPHQCGGFSAPAAPCISRPRPDTSSSGGGPAATARLGPGPARARSPRAPGPPAALRSPVSDRPGLATALCVRDSHRPQTDDLSAPSRGPFSSESCARAARAGPAAWSNRFTLLRIISDRGFQQNPRPRSILIRPSGLVHRMAEA